MKFVTSSNHEFSSGPLFARRPVQTAGSGGRQVERPPSPGPCRYTVVHPDCTVQSDRAGVEENKRPQTSLQVRYCPALTGPFRIGCPLLTECHSLRGRRVAIRLPTRPDHPDRLSSRGTSTSIQCHRHGISMRVSRGGWPSTEDITLLSNCFGLRLAGRTARVWRHAETPQSVKKAVRAPRPFRLRQGF
jgi:hypothetical protein